MNKDSVILLCQKNGDLFELFNKYNLDVEKAVSLFMTSKIATYFDKDITMYQYKNIYAIFDDFEKENISNISYSTYKKYSNESCQYLGFLYRYFILTKQITSKKMIKICSPYIVLNNYSYWHTLPFDRVIEIIQNEYRQNRYNHDVYQNKNSSNIKVDFDDPHLYSFLGKRIIYKLNRDIDIKNLVFSERYEGHLFFNVNAGISLEVVNSNNVLQDIKKSCELLKNKTTTNKNILFIFTKNISDSLIKEIKQTRFLSNPYFNDIYLYNNKSLYLLDEYDNTYKYSVKITKCDYNLSFKEALMFADE